MRGCKEQLWPGSRLAWRIQTPWSAGYVERFVAKSKASSSASPARKLLWKVITPKRWEVLRAMTGAGPLAIREVARRVQRDVKSVHGDIQALIKAGVLERAESGGVVFPYSEVHVDFVLRAA